MQRKSLAALLILTASLAAPAIADQHEASGYLADFTKDLEGACKKLVALAEAIPADKYGWRPAEGVRSVSETLVHVASGNYFFASRFGVEMPEGMGPQAEQTVTEKEAVMDLLKKSIEAAHQAAASAAEMDLDEQVDFFGSQRSRRSILMIMAGHAHEHLGQSIAYARSNGIAPPWSGGGDG